MALRHGKKLPLLQTQHFVYVSGWISVGTPPTKFMYVNHLYLTLRAHIALTDIDLCVVSRVVYDTGSANFWIPAKACHSGGCHGKRAYDHVCHPVSRVVFAMISKIRPLTVTVQQTSSTYKPDGRPLVIQYGTGDMRGTLVHDAVQVSSLRVNDFVFGEANYMADFFQQVCD
jgi:hypothetical protein